MPEAVTQLIARIHATETPLVIAVAGGGAGGVAQLLGVPGASRTVLEVVVPYSEAAMVSFLGGRPDQLCSPSAARSMAMAAYMRALALDPRERPKAGIGCTASLATDRPKRGAHRAHVAMQTAWLTATRSIQLSKGQRGRRGEEGVISRLLLNVVARACGVDAELQLGLIPGERVGVSQAVATEGWRDLLAARLRRVRHGGPAAEEGDTERVVFPGAFNPLHAGHRGMARIAEHLCDRPVEFEISILNVDKPPLDFHEIQARLAQFPPERTVWLTRARTFLEKSAEFPGATFVVGVDTLQRIADPRYYGESPGACRSALEEIAARGCRFLVFGRQMGEGFVRLGDLDLPSPLDRMCREVPADRFRQDISSTEIRRRACGGSGPG